MKVAVTLLSLPILLIICLAGSAGPQVAPAGEHGSYTLSVNVDLVVLPATVRDRTGHYVSDLREQDFEVYEDDVRQTIRFFLHEDIPVTVGLVIDHSGSMVTKLPHVIAAARTFVQTSNPKDRLFVVNFNEKVTLGLPGATSFTNRSDELEQAISRMRAGGMTALYDAIIGALERLPSVSREKKVLIVISDGGDNASARGLPEALKRAEQSSALLYTVGIFDKQDPDKNPGVLRRLALATGGEAYFPEDLHQVVAICERIARDIRNQYTLGYVSTNVSHPGAYRSIRVVATAAGRKLQVRARPGYFASAPGPVPNEGPK